MMFYCFGDGTQRVRGSVSGLHTEYKRYTGHKYANIPSCLQNIDETPPSWISGIMCPSAGALLRDVSISGCEGKFQSLAIYVYIYVFF